jgi:hypothetical protein
VEALLDACARIEDVLREIGHAPPEPPVDAFAGEHELMRRVANQTERVYHRRDLTTRGPTVITEKAAAPRET